MSPFERLQLFKGVVLIAIIENDERAVSSQLEGDLLDAIGTILNDDTSNSSRSCGRTPSSQEDVCKVLLIAWACCRPR